MFSSDCGIDIAYSFKLRQLNSGEISRKVGRADCGMIFQIRSNTITGKDTNHMSQSSFGNKFKVTTWGESHGKALGAVIDGCPAGLPLCEEDIQKFLDRRKPGQSRYTTARKEGDLVEILSGVFEGKTTGTPIALLIRNEDQRSKDYSAIENLHLI